MDLLAYERRLSGAGLSRVAGVDEAGRGALFGPVVAAAVILDWARGGWEGVRDSKTVPEKDREVLFDRIVGSCESWAVGAVEAREIDRTDILRATLKAMALAVEGLAPPPDYVLVDGNAFPRLHYRGEAVVHGDGVSLSIAAASIVAKVWRDRLVRDLGAEFPSYEVSQNKGYGTRAHLAALARFGPSPQHRISFRGVAGEDSSQPPGKTAVLPGLG